MTLKDIIHLTRVYCRDNNSKVFLEANIVLFINEAIDRMKQYKVFKSLEHLVHPTDELAVIPPHYQYIIPLYAAYRCFETDERFYEATEKRNEFESVFLDLINEIESGNTVITDSEGEVVTDLPNYIEYVTDEYFKPKRKCGDVDDSVH